MPTQVENKTARSPSVGDAIQRSWATRGWLACLLWPVALLFRLLVSVRRCLYRAKFLRSTRFSIPVIVVGNVVAGGAGKTPLVIALTQRLQNQGILAGVISRGYGRQTPESTEVLPETPISLSGDEPALIKRSVGASVFVASRRVDAASALIATYPDTQVLICDDGLQHYSIARNIEIAVFDDRGIGNGWLLPAGPLREPWPGRLSGGIDLVLHSGRRPAFGGFTATRHLADQAVAADGSKVSMDSLRGQKLVALAAIATPEAFFSMLRERGMELEGTIGLPDHHDFDAYELDVSPDTTVLCTEKDAVKLFGLPSMSGIRLLAVPLEFSPQPEFWAALDKLLTPLLSQLPSGHGHEIA